MTTPAAFKACFADWKLIRTRSCVQLVFEVPLEAADEAYQVVGGMPDQSRSAWFAIARLVEGGDAPATKHSTPDTRPRVASEQPRGAKSWHEMSFAQQAGILSNDPKFQKFVAEMGYAPDDLPPEMGSGEDIGRTGIYEFCGVLSRTELDKKPRAGERWRTLVENFRAWELEPRAGL